MCVFNWLISQTFLSSLRFLIHTLLWINQYEFFTQRHYEKIWEFEFVLLTLTTDECNVPLYRCGRKENKPMDYLLIQRHDTVSPHHILVLFQVSELSIYLFISPPSFSVSAELQTSKAPLLSSAQSYKFPAGCFLWKAIVCLLQLIEPRSCKSPATT